MATTIAPNRMRAYSGSPSQPPMITAPSSATAGFVAGDILAYRTASTATGLLEHINAGANVLTAAAGGRGLGILDQTPSFTPVAGDLLSLILLRPFEFYEGTLAGVYAQAQLGVQMATVDNATFGALISATPAAGVTLAFSPSRNVGITTGAFIGKNDATITAGTFNVVNTDLGVVGDTTIRIVFTVSASVTQLFG